MDLIVMGTHPLDSWIESVLGTHTRKIVRTASVPVLTIKKFVDFYSIKNIVFPTMLMNEREAVVHEVRTADVRQFEASVLKRSGDRYAAAKNRKTGAEYRRVSRLQHGIPLWLEEQLPDYGGAI